MIVVTGAAGFIGSVLTSKLNLLGHIDVVVADDFSNPEKNRNLAGKTTIEQVNRKDFAGWLGKNHHKVEFIFHIGARTDTAEFDKEVLNELNLNYSKMIWEKCTDYDIPLIYASSAATYGLGELGYKDDHHIVEKLKPLNPYGESKNEFDKWVLHQDAAPPFWAGFKFFNVYGPNEYHKGRMASVVFHTYKQILKTGKMKLFRSHHPDFEDGQQMRDFIYVKDVVNVLVYFMKNQGEPGLYNLGTGKARTFRHLAESTFRALDLKPEIEYIDTPADIRDKYQYFTEADMDKVRKYGYDKHFTTLEDGVEDYVKKFLKPGRYY
ncbi:MAG: ADP-glyceromanno-heptose 6-epimerase [Bacteroidales bacterium]